MATVLSAGSGESASRTQTNDESATIGELLRSTRERRGLTLESIANETKIPRRRLEALERLHVSSAPPGFYQRAEIRAYARAVGLDQNLVSARLEPVPEPVDVSEAVQAPRAHAPVLSRRNVAIGLALVAAAAAAPWIARTPTFGDTAGTGGVVATQALPIPDAVDARREEPAPARVTAPVISAVALPVGPPGVSLSARAGDGATQTARPPVPSSLTELVVTTQPAGARVTVNGIAWGVSPMSIRHLAPGDKRIRVSKDGYASEERTLRIGEGQRQSLVIRLDAAAP